MSLERNPRRAVDRQYSIGGYNRRVAQETDGLSWDPLMRSHVELFCTCGRDDCEECVWLTLAEYDEIRAEPYRFVVAPHHAVETVDDVTKRTEAYWIVELKPGYRRDW